LPSADTILGVNDGGFGPGEIAAERLAAAPADEGLVMRDTWDRYYDMAKTLGYEGHTARAEAMP
jgi:hypothetical protein